MKHMLSTVFLSVLLVSLHNCVPSQPFTVEEPEEGKSVVVGAILVENDGYENYYQPITENIYVAIAGKSTENGKEITEGYRVQTDENGYFMLQNVLPGAYVLKGIEFYLGVGTTMKLIAEWETNRKYFHITSEELNYFVRRWPDEVDSKVINLGINYFLIDRAPRVASFSTFEALDNRSLMLEDPYTMPNPVTYFQEKYPESGWFE
jgi:hypothetical protein